MNVIPFNSESQILEGRKTHRRSKNSRVVSTESFYDQLWDVQPCGTGLKKIVFSSKGKSKDKKKQKKKKKKKKKEKYENVYWCRL